MVKRVIVVGGGYAGAALSRALDNVAEVQLVDARDRFVHNVAAIRGVGRPVVAQSHLDSDMTGCSAAAASGRASSAAWSSSGVTLADGEQIEGDIVVVATGSSYASPFKPQGESTQEFAAKSPDGP